MAEFSKLGGGDAEKALAAFARRFGGYREGDFETLIGPLESVAESLGHLRRLSGLAAEAPLDVESALRTSSQFVRTLYRVGFGTALDLIAERAQGMGDDQFRNVIVRTCRAIAELDGEEPIVVGTLNYDGLLHAGFSGDSLHIGYGGPRCGLRDRSADAGWSLDVSSSKTA